jgi:molybdate transport system ATP-binding protein
MPAVLSLQSFSIVRDRQTIVPAFDLNLQHGEHLAITGPSGSGKTMLGQAICGALQHFGHKAIGAEKQPVFVSQMHHFKNKSNTSDMYYQQRYNSCDADDALTAREWLDSIDDITQQHLSLLSVAHVLDEPLTHLSNGEHKKMQLVKALQQHPGLLVLDQPFIGLDVASRQHLQAMLETLANTGVAIVLISSGYDLPACITHVLQLSKTASPVYSSKDVFLQTFHPVALQDGLQEKFAQLQSLLPKDNNANLHPEALRMENVQVSYDGKQVLQHINWTVQHGERWLVYGPNGAGKSTLLSLITADHPQVYANHICLYGKRRGKGETIWDIKKQMGFVSPELHLYFETTASAFETVASGLFDTIGLFRKLSPAQEAMVQQWLALFGFSNRTHKWLRSFSAGEQRLLLLARAMIKNPPMLVLDEPCQGLDETQEANMMHWIDALCLHGHKTLIFITHYQHSKPACITKTLQLNKGEMNIE